MTRFLVDYLKDLKDFWNATDLECIYAYQGLTNRTWIIWDQKEVINFKIGKINKITKENNMGSPSWQQFCKLGHLVLSVPAHCFEDEIEECPYCGSNVFHFEIEWGNPDNHEDINFPIPVKPIGQEWVDVNNSNFIGKMRVDIYDVSRVNKWRSKIITVKGMRFKKTVGQEFIYYNQIEGCYSVTKSKTDKFFLWKKIDEKFVEVDNKIYDNFEDCVDYIRSTENKKDKKDGQNDGNNIYV